MPWNLVLLIGVKLVHLLAFWVSILQIVQAKKSICLICGPSTVPVHDVFIHTWARSPMTSSKHEWLVTASHCTLIGSSHGIPPTAFVVMTGSHHGNNSDDWQSALSVASTWTELWWLEVIMGTVVMTGSHHGNKWWLTVSTSAASTWRVVMTWSHHANYYDHWQSAEKVCPVPFPRASTLHILVFREGSK